MLYIYIYIIIYYNIYMYFNFVFLCQVCITNDPRPENPYMKLYSIRYLGNVVGGYPIRYINLPIDQLKNYTIKSIKAEQVTKWFFSNYAYS